LTRRHFTPAVELLGFALFLPHYYVDPACISHEDSGMTDPAAPAPVRRDCSPFLEAFRY
jgi:hypothetical protein